jgi:HEAT repeat protein
MTACALRLRAAPQRALILLALAATGSGQRPVFSPDRLPPPPAPAPAPMPAPPPQAAPAGLVVEGPVTALLQRLAQWPSSAGREAAFVLAGLGEAARPALEASLGSNDWRVQAGAAFALAEMGSVASFELVQLHAHDPSNRAALPELLRAAVRLDPVRGGRLVLPFLGHESGRMRDAAREALPARVDPGFLPEILELWRSPRAPVRRLALEALARVPGSHDRSEWLTALGDPDARVAAFAAQTLALRADEAGLAVVREAARGEARRASAYALLALVRHEDRTGTPVLAGDPGIRDRILEFLREGDEFLRGAAAVAAANLSFRGEDAELRRLADRLLVPILLASVAGGAYFPDYGSIEDLCWAKLELLTGRGLGRDAGAWKSFWDEHGLNFSARRELREITAPSLLGARVVALEAGGTGGRLLLSGIEQDLGGSGAPPLVFDAGEAARLAAALAEADFLKPASGPEETGPGVIVSVSLAREAQVLERRFLGPHRARGMALWAALTGLAQDLSWEELLPGLDGASRLAAYRTLREQLTQAADPREREQRVLSMILEGYERLAPPRRAAAMARLLRAPCAWREANGARVRALLDHESTLSEAARLLIAAFAEDPSPPFRDRALALLVDAPQADAAPTLHALLVAQPRISLVGLVNHERPEVRAGSLLALARHGEDPDVKNLVILGLKDAEPRVREAAVQSLVQMRDERTLAFLLAIIQGEDEDLRPTAVQALAAVGGEQAIPRLHELFRDGTRPVRWAVVEGLSKVPGERSLAALSALFREPGDVETRVHVLRALVRNGGAEAAPWLLEALQGPYEDGLRFEALSLLERAAPEVAATVLPPLLEQERGELRRPLLFALARLGHRPVHEALVQELHRSLDGDLATERALEDLTFLVTTEPVPARRQESRRVFQARFGDLDRKSWFLLAASQLGLALDEAPDWLGTGPLRERECRELLRLVAEGTRPLRAHADRRLRGLLAPGLEPLPSAPSPAEIRERVGEFEARLSRSADGR